MIDVVSGWTMDVDRGPDWLFIKLHAPSDGGIHCDHLAEMLWSVMEQHFSRRLVLECEGISWLHSAVIGQLVLLHKRVYAQGGLMRLCGVSPNNQQALHACRMDSRFPSYACRTDAVMGHRPLQPR